jgi:hypothetical protein
VTDGMAKSDIDQDATQDLALDQRGGWSGEILCSIRFRDRFGFVRLLQPRTDQPAC